VNLKETLSEPCFNLSALERTLGIPRGSLEAFVAGRRGLAKKHQDKIRAYLEMFLITNL
jgi:plasmid maintenance system antidote protein VapI